MTQKELLYLEDAINHEKIIIKICQETINFLEDESLKQYLQNKIQTHTNMKEKLMNIMEVKTNE